jgi:hypothetical protein
MNHRAERMSVPTRTASLSLEPKTRCSNNAPQNPDPERQSGSVSQSGLLIFNADDWGRDRETTEHIFDCLVRGTVSSVSAMVFMEDSGRAAAMAQESRIDAGLHLNFTTPFSVSGCAAGLMKHQHKIAAYLLRHPLAQVVFHPGLVRSFEYVVKAQLDEFCRLYGTLPGRIDGHHHMHLCANVLLAGLLPRGTVVRRNFSFQPGEKSLVNRLYRKAVDHKLARRHRVVDFLFSLTPLNPPWRLQNIFSQATASTVEVETHPVRPDEYRFLLGDEILRWTANIRMAPHSAMSSCRTPTPA